MTNLWPNSAAQGTVVVAEVGKVAAVVARRGGASILAGMAMVAVATILTTGILGLAGMAVSRSTSAAFGKEVCEQESNLAFSFGVGCHFYEHTKFVCFYTNFVCSKK